MKLGVATDIVYWHEKLVLIHKKIAKETASHKPCTKVFVTFEKEASQRQCLKEMTTGKQDRAGQKVRRLFVCSIKCERRSDNSK